MRFSLNGPRPFWCAMTLSYYTNDQTTRPDPSSIKGVSYSIDSLMRNIFSHQHTIFSAFHSLCAILAIGMVVLRLVLLLFLYFSSVLSSPPILNSCINGKRNRVPCYISSAFRLNLDGETHRSNSTIDNCYDPSRMCMKYNFHGKGSFDYEKRTDMQNVFGAGGKCGDEHCEVSAISLISHLDCLGYME